MISFGIGLALLVSGFIFYELTNLIVTSAGSAGGILTAEVAEAIAQFTIIPGVILPYTPYIGIAVMVIGVGWFWVLAPLLYLTRPKKDWHQELGQLEED